MKKSMMIKTRNPDKPKIAVHCRLSAYMQYKQLVKTEKKRKNQSRNNHTSAESENLGNSQQHNVHFGLRTNHVLLEIVNQTGNQSYKLIIQLSYQRKIISNFSSSFWNLHVFLSKNCKLKLPILVEKDKQKKGRWKDWSSFFPFSMQKIHEQNSHGLVFNFNANPLRHISQIIHRLANFAQLLFLLCRVMLFVISHKFQIRNCTGPDRAETVFSR
jgi:hypothetical protein